MSNNHVTAKLKVSYPATMIKGKAVTSSEPSTLCTVLGRLEGLSSSLNKDSAFIYAYVLNNKVRSAPQYWSPESESLFSS